MYSDSDWKYKNDPVFRTAVDQMLALLHQSYLTPGELRQAATMASTEFEMRRIRPRRFIVSELENLQHQNYSLQEWGGHTFVSHGSYRVCSRCDMSDVYIKTFDVYCPKGYGNANSKV